MNEIETNLKTPDALTLTNIEKERDEYKDQMLLAKADLENARRRFERELDNAYKYAADKLIMELLPVVDSLETGLAFQVTEGSDELVKQLHAGMQLTLDLLVKTLKKHGIKILDPAGEVFNPFHHEAMSVQEDPNVKPNTILKVMQKGYLLHDRLVRPARVIVSK